MENLFVEREHALRHAHLLHIRRLAKGAEVQDANSQPRARSAAAGTARKAGVRKHAADDGSGGRKGDDEEPLDAMIAFDLAVEADGDLRLPADDRDELQWHASG
jgi:hypothetical protein